MPDRLGGIAYAVPDDEEKYLEYLRMLEGNEGYVPSNALGASKWISVPNPIPHREDYDTQFLLSGVTGGRVPLQL